MTLMELLGMERQQLQTRRELETFRVEARVAQVREKLGRAGVMHQPRPHPYGWLMVWSARWIAWSGPRPTDPP